jgi:membrane protease YdiL (CAAX protease family)
VKSGLGGTRLLVGAFILAVVIWQGWRDVARDRWMDAGGWRLERLPMVHIFGGLALATVLGLPPATALLVVLINTLLAGFSEELMFLGVLLQAFRHAAPIWPRSF